MLSEEELVTHRRGKWSAAGVPHKGWHCVDIEDLGEPQAECEMCESQTIRYVHYMEHRAYSGALAVGCVCAGHMEGSLATARDREASMRSRAGKRARWLGRAWKISAKGNPTIKADGYRVTVYERGGGYGATILVNQCVKDVGHHIQQPARSQLNQNRASLQPFNIAFFNRLTLALFAQLYRSFPT